MKWWYSFRFPIAIFGIVTEPELGVRLTCQQVRHGPLSAIAVL